MTDGRKGETDDIRSGNYSRKIMQTIIHSPHTDEAPEPQCVHSHAAAAHINCKGVEQDILVPFLDPIVERLLRLLNPTGENTKQPKCYVQEQDFLWLPTHAGLLSMCLVSSR